MSINKLLIALALGLALAACSKQEQAADAAAAADKAVAADPKRADAYYIKGQSLIPKATVDPKTQKIVAPPGCVEAYQQFIELAEGNPAEQARVEEVKGILTGIGAEVKSSFKATKGKK